MARARTESATLAPEPLLVPFEDLRPRGIRGSRHFIQEEVRAGRFPAPARQSENYIAWRWSDLVAWAKALPAAEPKPATNPAGRPRARG